MPPEAADDRPARAPDDLRPDTFTGRPIPLPPHPTVEQIRAEREELRRANAGRFTVEEPPDPRLPPAADLDPHRDPTFTVLTLLIGLNCAKLCLILWTLFTVLQIRDQNAVPESTRATITNDLATLQRQLDQGVSQQQVLIDRVDDVLVRLAQPPQPPPSR